LQELKRVIPVALGSHFFVGKLARKAATSSLFLISSRREFF
jgi:hypothetical protein